MSLSPERTVAELRELQELTGDENGAQRVAWTDTWAQAREWLRGRLEGDQPPLWIGRNSPRSSGCCMMRASGESGNVGSVTRLFSF